MEPFLNSKWPEPFGSVPNLDPPPKVDFDFMVFDYEERDEPVPFSEYASQCTLKYTF